MKSLIKRYERERKKKGWEPLFQRIEKGGQNFLSHVMYVSARYRATAIPTFDARRAEIH